MIDLVILLASRTIFRSVSCLVQGVQLRSRLVLVLLGEDTGLAVIFVVYVLHIDGTLQVSRTQPGIREHFELFIDTGFTEPLVSVDDSLFPLSLICFALNLFELSLDFGFDLVLGGVLFLYLIQFFTHFGFGLRAFLGQVINLVLSLCQFLAQSRELLFHLILTRLIAHISFLFHCLHISLQSCELLLLFSQILTQCRKLSRLLPCIYIISSVFASLVGQLLHKLVDLLRKLLILSLPHGPLSDY